jgi:acetylornithine deacetylase/succinyl-diaminopimelate desuccinylase-like protein
MCQVFRALNVTLVLATLVSAPLAPAAGQSQNLQPVKEYVKAHQEELIREYIAYVSVPDLHGDLPNLARNAEALRKMLAKRDLHPEVWTVEKGAPVVYGERMAPGAARTILFYIHYDGQPVDPKGWAQTDPFVPMIRTDTIEHGGKEVKDLSAVHEFPPAWRVYARGAGDDKVPIECLLGAIDALGPRIRDNIKIFMHGEEEGEGPNLAAAIQQHPDKLKADLLVILDGPQHPTGRPTMYYGARGGARLQVTVYTAKNSMHSGNYGNWVPDANVRLAQLISSLVDPTGKVVIDGFYDDVLPFSKPALAMIQAVPDNSKQMQKDYGVGSTDGAASSLQEGLNLPALSIHTMQGGEAGGVIAAHATAEIAMRLVKENDPAVMVNRVLAHIRKQGYYIVTSDPDVNTLASHPRVVKVTSSSLANGTRSGAWRTEPEESQARFVRTALASTWPGQLVELRTLGGGVPASDFIDAFHIQTIGIALANYDDNQHSDNENLRIGNLYDGIATLAGLVSQ